MTDFTTDLDRMIELQDLRALVLSGQPLPPERYRKLIDSIRGERENAARIAAANNRKAKKTLTSREVDLSRLFC